MVSVFTPTYNRVCVLENLYRSLLEQSSYDFEWIIVDDGSEDGTEELVGSWMKMTEKFPIIYKKMSHGGKHRAINYGVTLAQSEAFFIVDSDDTLTQDAIEFINEEFVKIIDRIEYAGISGLKQYKDESVIGGEPFFSDYVDVTNFEREKYGLLGDKAEVYKLSVLKRYPFPEFANEFFLAEAVVWDAIAFDGFKLRWFNKALYYAEYMPDGLSRNGYRRFKESPSGWAELIRCERFYGKLKGEKLFDAYFSFIERVDLSQEVICKLLEITEKEYQVFFIKKKLILERINKRLETHTIKSLALYGYGNNARRLMEYINRNEIKVPYVIDRNYADICEVPAYALHMELPEVDSVCITLKKPDPEIRSILEKKLPNAYIWQFTDLDV